MPTAKNHCYFGIIIFIILGLIFAPIPPPTALAAGQGTDKSDTDRKKLPIEPGSGAAAGVDVSGTPEKGKGALPPSQETSPTTPDESEEKPVPAERPQDQEKKNSQAIGASAGEAGPTTEETGKGLSLGWKITAGVLGVGLLLGLAGGGGGGGGGGGPTTPAHSP